jgi:release factor glutamine methyltransferase
LSEQGERSWRDLYEAAAARLGSKIDARRIVERAGADYPLGLDDPVRARAVLFVEGMIDRRAAGEPLQYVLGRWGFRRLELLVDRRVLIPRPETEVVVEVALREAHRLGLEGLVAADLGTGSGAIALSLASELPGVEVWGTDSSAAALAVARANLAGLGTLVATRVRLAEGSWFDALPAELRGRVGLVVSNPPYVAESDDLPAVVGDWEPAGALVSGPTGLEALLRLVAQAPAWLARPGALVLECAPHQAHVVAAQGRSGGASEVEIELDLSGRERAVVLRFEDPD